MMRNFSNSNPMPVDDLVDDLNVVDSQQLRLLSAYIDGEATPDECREVQHLLDHDAEFKRQYLHLHQIRQGLQAMPTPASQSHQDLAQRVFRALRWRRSKVVSLWGGGAIAALFVAGLVSQLPGTNNSLQLAEKPIQPTTPEVVSPMPNNGEPLVVALNRPVLQIPKLATTENLP
jgi:anti-sigma factor RsiW